MDTPTLVPGTCYYRQVCYLTLVLALADSEREYRCTVENDGDKDSASLTLGIVNEDGKLTEMPVIIGYINIHTDLFFSVQYVIFETGNIYILFI